MNKRLVIFIVRVLAAVVIALNVAPVTPASAADLMIPIAGRVTIELITSDAAFSNTLSVISPTVGIAASGCNLEPAVGLTGVLVLSEKISQHGCRVDLDADPATAGIQGFAANTTFEFGMCAQENPDPDCEFVWSSNPSNNSDGFDHVQTTTLSPGVFQLAWEDKENGGDMDFNDLIVVVRVQADADGDGLWDDWEQSGVDTDGNGTPDFNLPALGANPNRKDIFMEIDYMDCTVAGGDCPSGDTHNHRPKMAAVNAVIAAFANAPVPNPDGSTGITVHIEVDDALAHQNFLALGCGFGTSFDTVKADPANFGTTNPRRFTHHYVIFAHRQAANTTSSGCGERPGNDFIVTLGEWNTICIGTGTDGVLNTTPAGDDVTDGANFVFTGPNLVCNTTAATNDQQFIANGSSPTSDLDGDGLDDRTVGTIQEQAGTLMHEFGHNLNLDHGGADGLNYKPNYLSIMNYAFQTRGIPPTDPDGAGPLTARIDYSNDVLPSCIGPGANGVLNTAPAVDDTVSGNFIRSGPNLTCNTTAVPDDAQFVPNGSTAALVENTLNETNGIGDGTDNTRYFCPTGNQNVGPATGAIDWNCDLDGGADTNVSVNINADFNDANGNGRQDPGEASIFGYLNGSEDWNNLKYDFQSAGDFEDGVHNSTTTIVEIDFPTHLEVPQSVSIDIKPGGVPNSISCKKKNQVITVAILTNDDFDALSVDHTSVSFAGASEIHRDQNGPIRHEEDVDFDGDTDLVFHFRLGDTSLTCDSTQGTLFGTTFDGSAIVGTDSVQMVP
jgi:hypothetical protein